MFSPAIVSNNPARQYAYDFGFLNAHLSDGDWQRILPKVIPAPDMVAASIGRRDAQA